MTIAKQIAVPHGNSVLALGSVDDVVHGTPHIPDIPIPYPGSTDWKEADVPAYPYYTKLDQVSDYENPNPDYTLNPNRPLQDAVNKIAPNAYLRWSVTTAPLPNAEHPVAEGRVTNIPFEQKRAKVASYDAEYWLLSKDKGHTFEYLVYNQLMNLTISLTGQPYTFPHVTTNVVKCYQKC